MWTDTDSVAGCFMETQEASTSGAFVGAIS
jgi:hypothetical protein